MKYLTYAVILFLLAIVSCDLPSEYTVYHWAEHWIAVADNSGQNIRFVHRSVRLNYNTDYLRSFRENGNLKILDADFNKIIVMDADGQNAKTIVTGADYIGRCSVSYDGKYIAFPLKGNIYTATIDGEQRNAITQDTSFYDSAPYFSPVNAEIVFVRNWEKSKKAAIMLMSESGDQITKITDNFADPSQIKSFSYPTFGKDGQRIYFNYYNGDVTSGIYVIDRNGQNKKLIFSSVAIGNPIEISPDGRVGFAFSGQLYVSDAQGNQIIRLGNQFEIGHPPYRFSFSVTGDSLILSDGEYYNAKVKIIELATQKETIVTTGWSPSFLPDGRILFVGKKWYESKNSKDMPYDRIFF